MGSTTHLLLARQGRMTISRRRVATASRTSLTTPNLVASKLQPIQGAQVGSTVHPVRTQAMGNRRLLILRIPKTVIAHILAKVSSIPTLPSRTRRIQAIRVDTTLMALRHPYLRILALRTVSINHHPIAQATRCNRAMEGKVTDSSPSKEGTASQVRPTEILALRLHLDGVLER